MDKESYGGYLTVLGSLREIIVIIKFKLRDINIRPASVRSRFDLKRWLDWGLNDFADDQKTSLE